MNPGAREGPVIQAERQTMTDTQEPEDSLLTIRDLAARWKVSLSTIRREIGRRRIKSLMIGGQLRFTREEVERYEREA